jgi:hypothetical protein
MFDSGSVVNWNTSPLCVAYSSEDGKVTGTVELES